MPHDSKISSHTHEIPWNNAWDNKELYIAVHAAVCGRHYSIDNGGRVEFCPPHYDAEGLVKVVSFEPCDANWKLCSVCYQEKEFRFETTFEANQCTNNAAQENGWLCFCNQER